ncbi:MAG: YigZ family protein [Nanoarchaeota archaeon]|nr:YigZ family protein [Nanoarchaeota archaeon]
MNKPLLISTYTVQKSKFISELYKIDAELEIENIISNIKQNHLKANHICYCAILHKDVVIKHDKEVGSPGNILYNILHYNNYNSHLLVTIRYFGGIKLGVGGVIKAFKKSATSCIEKSKVEENK